MEFTRPFLHITQIDRTHKDNPYQGFDQEREFQTTIRGTLFMQDVQKAMESGGLQTMPMSDFMLQMMVHSFGAQPYGWKWEAQYDTHAQYIKVKFIIDEKRAKLVANSAHNTDRDVWWEVKLLTDKDVIEQGEIENRRLLEVAIANAKKKRQRRLRV